MQTDGGTGAGLSFPICGLSLSVCRCCAYGVTCLPSGNWKPIRRSAPRAAAIRCHSSSVNFPVFNRLLSNCGDHSSRAASSACVIPAVAVAILMNCLHSIFYTSETIIHESTNIVNLFLKKI